MNIITKKIFVLLLLTLCSGLAGYFLNDVDSAVKKTIMLSENNNLGDYSVLFSNETLQVLNDYYVITDDKEYSTCLIGYIENATVFVTKTNKFKLGDNDSVISNSCFGKEYVGSLHKHPNHLWYPSHADTHSSFIKFREHKNLINIIQYDKQKFNIMTEKNWRSGTKLELQ